MPETSIPSLFCSNCLSYYPQNAPVCPICGSSRERRLQVKPPLTPDWQVNLPGKPIGLTGLDSSTVLVAWNRYSDEITIGLPEGGLRCLDVNTQEVLWNQAFDRPAIGSPVIFGDWILQLTGRRAPDPARLLVFDRNFQPVWSYDFPDPVTPTIIPYNEWVCCAVSDGTLIGVNPATKKGGILARWDTTPRLNPPKSLAWQSPNTFYLATGTRPGQILRIQGKNVATIFTVDDHAYITDLLVPGGPLLYVGDEQGRLFAVDNAGQIAWSYEAENRRNAITRLGGIVFLGDHLFFGAGDHKIRCLNRFSGDIVWETSVKGTVMVNPLIWNDSLLICGDSHGQTYGLNLNTGEIIWQYWEQSSMHWSISGNLLRVDDRVLFSTRSTNPIGEPGGRLWSMPYHAGQHLWAARMLAAHNKPLEAAEQYVHQAQWCLDECDRISLLETAASTWEQKFEPEWGARLWQGVGYRQRAAEGYKKASQIWRIRDPERAAFYCLQAADVLEQDNQSEEAERMRNEAGALSPLPYLCLELATNPTLVQHENGEVTLRIKNTGRASARNIEVYVGGTLLHSINFSADSHQEIPPNRWWHLTFNIAPSQLENQLDVCVECVDRKERKDPFRHFFTGKIMATPAPITIKAGDMVKGKIKLKGFKGEPIRLEVGDMVMSEVEIEA
jgi:outer membrane protein assembly factor BamB